MGHLIPNRKSLNENATYTGLPSEVVSIPGVGIAIHDGVTPGGVVVRNQTVSNENIIRNPKFKVRQNGNSWMGNSGFSTYIADGWYISHAGGSTSNIILLDDGIRITAMSGGNDNSYSRFIQVIPRPLGYSLSEMTLSFEASSAQSPSIAAEVFITGTSGGEISFVGRFDLTPDRERYEATFTTTEYVVNNNLTDNMKLAFWLEAGDDYNDRTGGILPLQSTVDIDNIKLEFGANSTPLNYNFLDDERKVMEIFEVSETSDVPLLMSDITIDGADEDVIITVPYKVAKWKSTTPTYTSQFTNSDSVYNSGRSSFQVLGEGDASSSAARIASYTCNAEISL